MDIGQRIKKARKSAGLTQKGLAAQIGAATGTIQQYELGKRQPRLEQLQAIAHALDTSVSELVEPGYWSTVSREEVEESWGGSAMGPAVQMSARERVDTALGKLNDAGMEKAADAVEIIAEVPRYKAGKAPSEAAGAPPASQEGKNTTSAPDAPTGAPEGPERG